MSRVSALCAAAALTLAGPVSATTFTLAYSGAVSFQPPNFGGTVRLDETGNGRLTLDTTLSDISLAAGLSDFSFTTDLQETVLPVNQPSTTFSAGSVTYGLADLSSFDATLVNGAITSLSFQTKAKSVYYGGGSTVSFYDFDGSGGSLLHAGGPSPLGSIRVTPPAVPEPASWATMLAGFGVIGGVVRRRRSAPRTLA